MVICKYFQTGNCRFGSKCNNEHFDIKQYIKTEVEAALKGSQWPLSCFGIFKEKPCIPNFIEDQSYEEVRYMCYKAKKENYFPAFEQQFTQQVMDAQNKMKTLLTLSREVVDAIIKLYDDAELAQKGGQPQNQQQQQQTSNPFSLGSSVLGQANSSGLFGSNPTQSTVFPSSGSSFGGSISSTGGVYGGQSVSTSGGLVGQSSFGSSGFASNQSSAFGGQQTNTFSLNQLGQQSGAQTQGGNIFSISSQPSQVTTGSIFGGNVQQQQQQQQQNPFGSSSAFNANQGQTSIFRQAAQQQQPQQSVAGGNLFAQPNQPAGSFGGFSQVQAQAAPAFGMQQSAGIFRQQQQQPQQQFQTQPQQQQVQQQLPQQQSGQNIFGAPQQDPFYQQQQQQPQQGVTAGLVGQQGTFFGTSQQPNVGGAFLGVANQNQQGNSFGQIQQNTISQPLQAQTPAGDYNDTVYSKMENLSPEEIEAFRADIFILGQIPTSPPPRELVN